MRIALMTDIHANREAFSACLAHAEAAGAARYVFLGDYVGYGADPEWVVATLAEMADDGAVLVAGNHDRAVAAPRGGMTENAAFAIGWTRDRLDAAAHAFLAALPLTAEDEDRLYVHADASAPGEWIYVEDPGTAAASVAATYQRLTFVGHVHVPMLYAIAAAQKPMRFQPATAAPVQLLRQCRWLAVVGSVGQPRDRNPDAAYAIYDTETAEFTSLRVPYDIEAAAAKIRAAGLPEVLAARLALGR